ncbi:MAG TPA: hypothetical protein VLG28_04830 [Acidimicrobiia bacterium]|jgi:hypothetical protein|nr:hypothetical protein [Acidimicrobiia bacterium]
MRRPALAWFPIVLLAVGCSAAQSAATSESSTTVGLASEATTTTRAPAGAGATTTTADVTSTSAAADTTAPPTSQPPQPEFVPNPPPPGATVCDRFTTITEVGRIGEPALVESSGIAASRTHQGVYWLHNDSGDDASIYAVTADGTALGEWSLEGVIAFDWEDMAIGPGPSRGVDYLYVADIGDNFEFRPEVIVHRLPEPDPRAGGAATDIVSFRLRYPISPTDAEAVVVDPINGDLLIITKSDAGRSIVLRAAGVAAIESDTVLEMTEVATLQLGSGGLATAADLSRDGTMIAVRGYDQVWMWPRSERDLGVAFAEPPCAAPSPVERQGEALAFTADGLGYVTVSEGSGVPLWQVGP